MNNDTFIGRSAPANVTITYTDKPPKHAYDLEYSTQVRREYEFLKKNGIEPTFTRHGEYGIRTYKYTKTPALFKLLVEYYGMIEAEKGFNQAVQELEGAKKVQIYA